MKTNNNTLGKFPDKKKIACTHVVLTKVQIEQKHREGLLGAINIKPPVEDNSSQESLVEITPSERADRQRAFMGTIEDLEKTADPRTQGIYEQLIKEAPSTALVGHTQWGPPIIGYFASVDINGERHIGVSSSSHFLGLSLQRKEIPNGDTYYEVSLFDPNTMMLEASFIVSDLEELRNFRVDTLLRKSDVAFYFGPVKPENTELEDTQPQDAQLKIEISHFIPIPANMNARMESNQPLFSGETERKVDLFLSDAEQLDPGVFHHWLLADLPIPMSQLQSKVAACSTPEKKGTLLAAELKDGTPGRFVGLQNSSEKAIGQHNSILVTNRENDLIDTPTFVKISLGERKDGTSGRSRAMEKGLINMVDLDDQLFTIGCSNKWIDGATLERHLLSKDASGTPADCLATANGHAECLEKSYKMLLKAKQENWLGKRAFSNVVHARSADGVTVRYLASQNGDENIMRINNGLLRDARKDDGLDDSVSFFKLVEGRRDDGVPVRLVAVISGRGAGATKLETEFHLEAREKGWLSNKELATLWLAEHDNKNEEPSARPLAVATNQANFLAADNEGILAARENEWLDEDDFIKIITADMPDKSSPRCHATLLSNDEALSIDNKLLFTSRKKNWITLPVLIDRLAAKNSVGMPVHLEAMFNNNENAVKTNNLTLIEGAKLGVLDSPALTHLFRGGSVVPARFFAAQKNAFQAIKAENRAIFSLREENLLDRSSFVEILAAKRLNDGLAMRGFALGAGNSTAIREDNATLILDSVVFIV